MRCVLSLLIKAPVLTGAFYYFNSLTNPLISLQYLALFCIQPRSLGGVFDALINYQQQKRHYPQAESLKLS